MSAPSSQSTADSSDPDEGQRASLIHETSKQHLEMRNGVDERPSEPSNLSPPEHQSTQPVKPRQNYQIKAEECISIPDQVDDTVRNRPTYISFGDDGTTASVTDDGGLMQISKFLGVGASGFFCIDRPWISEPYLVEDRAQDLANPALNEYVIGCSFDEGVPKGLDPIAEMKPTVEFVQDRWPRFVVGTEHVTSTSHFFVHQGTIFDVWTCGWKKGSPPAMPNLFFHPSMLIRELDFTKFDHEFNKAGVEDEGYKVSLGPDGNSIILAHTGFEGTEGPEVSIGLLITIFVNQKLQKLEQVEGIPETRRPWFSIKHHENESGTQGPQTFELTIAYKLQVLPDAYEEPGLVSFPEYHALEEVLVPFSYSKLEFSSDTHLDFIIRRNLEHILSVCSIPLRPGQLCSADGIVDDDVEQEIALTCGDFSGHRLVNSASFFAFQFLLWTFQYLEKLDRGSEDDSDPRVSTRHRIQERIRKTCKGHLHWLFKKADKPGGYFAANYWATGRDVSNPELHSALSDRSWCDTPFQIIKLSEFTRKMNHDKEWARSLLDGIVSPWIKSLDKADKWRVSAFRRPETQQYRLGDHVWIWKALVEIEKLDLGENLNGKGRYSRRPFGKVGPPKDGDGDKKQSPSEKPPVADFSSASIRRNVLKRFTTENTASRRRMLATTRTNLNTRFLFHSTDTVLFYENDSQFFSTSEPLWDSTIEAQKFHEENDDQFRWGNPLRYALALMMGSKGHEINMRPVEDMLAKARTILLGSSSSNGLIPGQLDDVSKEPQLSDERWRDFYWRVSFEAAYILWTHNESLVQPSAPGPQRPRPAARLSSFRSPVLLPRLSADGNAGPQITQLQAEEPVPPAKQKVVRKNTQSPTDLQGEESLLATVENFNMKKEIPFNVHIDKKSIVELPDEWLYDYPDTFGFGPNFPKDVLQELSSNHPEIPTGTVASEDCDPVGKFQMLDPASPSDLPLRITQSEDHTQHLSHHDSNSSKVEPKESASPTLHDRPAKTLKGIVLDVPTTAQTKGHKTGPRCERPEDEAVPKNTAGIYKALNQVRKAKHAKKRLIWLPNVDPLTEKLCIFASPEFERDYVEAFFERHRSKKMLFFDDATAALNVWRTELRLSFYQLFEHSESGNTSHTGLSFLGKEGRIERATMGFLFIGDFLDRHWTCHFLEHNPVEHSKKLEVFGNNEKNVSKLTARFQNIINPKLLPTTDRERRPWRQRKVLELLLFDRMVQAISTQYERMLAAISEHLFEQLPSAKRNQQDLERNDVRAVSNILFSSQMDNDTYHKFSAIWSPTQYTLQAMEDDLRDNLDKIALWTAREAERKTEKPRWTKNDEGKYRSAINKLSISNSQGIRDLQHHVSVINSLRKSLAERLESTRNQLSFDSSENVKFFTYTTVVFLPLGFATGVYSMNGAPGHPVLRGMVATAGVALLLTLLVLVNAKTLDKVAKPVVWVNAKVLARVFEAVGAAAGGVRDWTVGYFAAAKGGAGHHDGAPEAAADAEKMAAGLSGRRSGLKARLGKYRMSWNWNGRASDASAQLEAGTENTSK